MGISLLHRRESIIISTIGVLNEVGLQNLSTKLIAKREDVSEGTLFRHFICSYAEYYENYPAITELVQAYDSLMCDSELSEDLFYFIREDKPQNINVFSLCDIVLEAVDFMKLEFWERWKMIKKYK